MSSFEQLFQIQLTENNQKVDDLVELYFQIFEDEQLDDLKGFCHFLFFSGRYEKVIELFLKVSDKVEDLKIQTFPWLILFESVLRLSPTLPANLKSSLYELIKELDLKGEFSRSDLGRKALPELTAEFEKMRDAASEELKLLKHSLFEQARSYEVQNLVDLQRSTLEKLKRLDPGDHRIIEEGKKLIERNALDVLSRRSVFSRSTLAKQKDDSLRPEVAQFISEQMNLPEQATEYAVALVTWGYPHLALHVLRQSHSESSESDWLECELLLELGRHAELLSALYTIEQRLAHDSETFFKTAYLRAQAFWGLGQKEKAIETMESLLASKPDFRAGHTLLLLWSGE